MQEPAGTRLVLNSYLFYEAIAQTVMTEQAEPAEVGDSPTTEPGQPLNRLYDVIVQNRHKIVVTQRIVDEYQKERTRYQGISLVQIIDALQISGVLINPKGAGKPELTGMPQQHRALVEEAIRTRTRYLITRNPAWHQRAQYLEESHNLKVLNRDQYIG